MAKAARAEGKHLVVVGGGQAAAQLIEVARQRGFEGAITLVSDEPVLPYMRPPLSKQYLAGRHGADWLLYRPANFYPKWAVETLLGRRATAIETAAKVVLTDDGQELPYTALAIATGARARRLDIPGADHRHVYYIRTLADVDELRARLGGARRAIIIGAGFIGLETAAVLVQRGVRVTLLAAAERLLPRIVDGEVATFLLQHHLKHGVEVVISASVFELIEAGGTLTAVLQDGRRYEADLVLVGIGALPNVELAEAAGLHCDNGIVVDEMARTSDPAIVAAGDCTNHPNGLIGRRLRLETVHNAVEQGRTAGATLAGHELPYQQTPWVWSDQYDLRLQAVGVSEGYDRTVVRGVPGEGRFSLFYYRENQLLAVNSINQPLIFGAVRQLLNERIPLLPEQAADARFELTQLLQSTVSLDFDVPWPSKFDKQGTLAWGFE